jgi:hypothetical protein
MFPWPSSSIRRTAPKVVLALVALLAGTAQGQTLPDDKAALLLFKGGVTDDQVCVEAGAGFLKSL